jgi:hypothetical protein
MPLPESSLVPVSSHQSLASFRSEIDAIDEKDVLTPRVDVAAAAIAAIGAMPEIEAHRRVIVSRFGESAGSTLDRLVPAARALLAAHAAHVRVAERDLEPMAAELMETRSRLFNAASALIERGVVDRKSLSGLVGGQSYQGRVVDTLAITGWFRDYAETIAPFSKVTVASLDSADALAEAFAQAYGARDQAQAGTTAPARDRARMFTLFFRTYERVRQMLTYLRWHEDDVEQIAPSLYTRRSRSREADVDTDAESPSPPPNPIEPGLPGADPFTS